MIFSCFQVAVNFDGRASISLRAFPKQRQETFAKDRPKQISGIE